MAFTLKLACLFSLITVCLHTPRTLELIPWLEFPILAADFCATFVFSLEAMLKINNMGYFMVSLILKSFFVSNGNLHIISLKQSIKFLEANSLFSRSLVSI